jgi:hypothetical protein
MEQVPEPSYRPPDGRWTLNSERFRVSEVLFRPDALPSSLYADGTYPVDLIRAFTRALCVTLHNNVNADTERVVQLSIQELVMRSILASPTELQYVNYILEAASKERESC